jgi:hypothetical protein
VEDSKVRPAADRDADTKAGSRHQGPEAGVNGVVGRLSVAGGQFEDLGGMAILAMQEPRAREHVKKLIFGLLSTT